MPWADRIGRRVKLRDLHILLTVAQSGSLSRAAEQLAVSYPVVSRAISDLEQALGARLFDRLARGVELTMYGQAFLKCGVAVFDELRRGVQQIELLADPSVGELRIGTNFALAEGLLSNVIDRIVHRFPRIAVQVRTEGGRVLRDALRQRAIDVAIVPSRPSMVHDQDLECEPLFEERLFVVAGAESRWARLRRIELAELMNEHWVLPLPDPLPGALTASGFRACGLSLPTRLVESESIHFRINLVATGRYLSVLPESLLRFARDTLPVRKLPLPPLVEALPYEILTLKSRTLSPIAELFLERVRGIAKQLIKNRPRKLEKEPPLRRLAN
jgi:DNA-binding transcriptional LysR family regulator